MLGRLDNRPLLGTIDRDLFVSRSGMSTLVPAVERGLNVLVLGARRSGKTTLLRSLEADLDTAKRPAVYVDLALARNVSDALALIADALSERWQQFGGTLASERTRSTLLRQRLDQGGATADQLRLQLMPEETPTAALLRRVRVLGLAPDSLILADSPPGEGEAHTLFGRLRDELWQQGHQWVVAANDVLRDELTRPPANAFFDVKLELGPMSRSEQREFLMRRLVAEAGVDVEALLDETDGLPGSLLELAREAALTGQPLNQLLAIRDEQHARVAKLPAAASKIVEYLSDHGATSGSDPQLLATLGFSGQRARQLLRGLEDEGLVRSFSEQQERRGRPRKLYELRGTTG